MQTNPAGPQFCHRPIPIRLLNWIGSILDRLGISLANRSEDSLMAAACRRTGLPDWGDESFREPLRVLLKSYRKDGMINFVGWFMIHELLIMHLSNRLHIQKELKRHPEILQESIRKPLFIISLPRTGTTLLQRLLSLEPSNRSLLYWEAINPAPPPEPQTHETDPRIAEAEKKLLALNKMAPSYASIHPMHAKGAEECIILLANSFSFPSFHLFAKNTQYTEWLRGQNMVPIYLYYRRQLQLLQSRYPTGRWILKAPLHMHYIDTLLEIFPDACVVQIHRDPLKVIPSVCSLVANLRGIYSDHMNPYLIGQEFLSELKIMAEKSSVARDAADPDRFYDIHYKDLVQDPAGTVRRIYKHFGYEFDSRFEERMHEYLSANPQDKHGVHHYSLEQFGLDRDMVNRSFAAYCERFGIIQE